MTEILDRFADVSAWPEALRQLEAIPWNERDELRVEVVRRLAAGELAPEAALAVLPVVEAEPVVPDLVRLLRSPAAPLPARAAALLLLRRHTTYDVAAEIDTLEIESAPELINTVIAMQAAADTALQKGTPFERLALADPEDDEVDIEDIVEELIDEFCASPEAAAAGDRDELQFWAGELVHLGVSYGYGSPLLWGSGTIEEVLTELLPQKLTIESVDDAKGAVPAFRTFFR